LFFTCDEAPAGPPIALPTDYKERMGREKLLLIERQAGMTSGKKGG